MKQKKPSKSHVEDIINNGSNERFTKGNCLEGSS